MNVLPELSSFLSEFHEVRPDVLGVSLYHHYDRNAVRHLFRVSAGLDSMMLGEAEILGQVREAYRFAHEQGATGPVLNRMFQAALEVGKRVRSETELGTRPVSVASAGVKLAERIFGKLANAHSVGLGARHHQRTGGGAVARPRNCAIVGDEPFAGTCARKLAAEVRGTVVPWGEWDAALQTPDMMVSSVAAEDPILQREVIERAMAARGNRALLLMDLGLPRNIDAAAAELYNVYLYNLDDLGEIVEQGRAMRAERDSSSGNDRRRACREISVVAGQRGAGRLARGIAWPAGGGAGLLCAGAT